MLGVEELKGFWLDDGWSGVQDELVVKVEGGDRIRCSCWSAELLLVALGWLGAGRGRSRGGRLASELRLPTEAASPGCPIGASVAGSGTRPSGSMSVDVWVTEEATPACTSLRSPRPAPAALLLDGLMITVVCILAKISVIWSRCHIDGRSDPRLHRDEDRHRQHKYGI